MNLKIPHYQARNRKDYYQLFFKAAVVGRTLQIINKQRACHEKHDTGLPTVSMQLRFFRWFFIRGAIKKEVGQTKIGKDCILHSYFFRPRPSVCGTSIRSAFIFRNSVLGSMPKSCAVRFRRPLWRRRISVISSFFHCLETHRRETVLRK